ncbi:hypothetical protein AK88_04289 [Plasmodium fragile]|uniref:Schizont-infected cell agglutination extracellular alpha domain-containing protein n=1 Tax=Plasmodium fragile TaxID=5857 RepID=A0A0D9QGL5_PLAFR|nr:uncharacterized protein AK88_04289 [Plasmodium fragile]KJP86098.1 hypothetical protein AK88_04289 [Plasmodium fragile]
MMDQFLTYMEKDNDTLVTSCDDKGWGPTGITNWHNEDDTVVCKMMVPALFFMNGWGTGEHGGYDASAARTPLDTYIRCIIVNVFMFQLMKANCGRNHGIRQALHILDQFMATVTHAVNLNMCTWVVNNELKVGGKVIGAEFAEWIRGNATMKAKMKQLQERVKCKRTGKQTSDHWKRRMELLKEGQLRGAMEKEMTSILKKVGKQVEEIWGPVPSEDDDEDDDDDEDVDEDDKDEEDANGKTSKNTTRAAAKPVATKPAAPTPQGAKPAAIKPATTKPVQPTTGDQASGTGTPSQGKGEGVARNEDTEDTAPSPPAQPPVSPPDSAGTGPGSPTSATGSQPQAPASPVLPAPGTQPPPPAETPKEPPAPGGTAGEGQGPGQGPGPGQQPPQAPSSQPGIDGTLRTDSGKTPMINTDKTSVQQESPRTEKECEKYGSDHVKLGDCLDKVLEPKVHHVSVKSMSVDPTLRNNKTQMQNQVKLHSQRNQHQPRHKKHPKQQLHRPPPAQPGPQDDAKPEKTSEDGSPGNGRHKDAVVDGGGNGQNDDPPPPNPPKPKPNPNPNQSGSSGSSGVPDPGTGVAGGDGGGSSGAGSTGTVKPTSSGTDSTGHGTAPTGGGRAALTPDTPSVLPGLTWDDVKPYTPAIIPAVVGIGIIAFFLWKVSIYDNAGMLHVQDVYASETPDGLQYMIVLTNILLHPRTIIDIHLEVLNECEATEWENVKDDYLQIVVQEFAQDLMRDPIMCSSILDAPSTNQGLSGINGSSTVDPPIDSDGIDPCRPNEDNPDPWSCMETIQLETDTSASNDPDPWNCMETIPFATDTCPPNDDDPDPWKCMETIQFATHPCPPNDPDPWNCMETIQLATHPCAPNEDDPWRCMETIQFATDPCAPHAHDHDPWSCMQSIQLDAEQSRAHSNHRQANSAHDWHTHWIPWIDRNKHILRACTTQPWFLQLKAAWKQYLREHMATNAASGEHRTAATMERQKLDLWRQWIAQQYRQMSTYTAEEWFQYLLRNIEEENTLHGQRVPGANKEPVQAAIISGLNTEDTHLMPEVPHEEHIPSTTVKQREQQDLYPDLYRTKSLTAKTWILLLALVIEQCEVESSLHDRELYVDDLLHKLCN